MPGVKGRSGGHNRRSLADHQLRGTFKRSRHSGLLAPPAPQPLPYDWKPDPQDLAPLSARAQRFLADALRTHEFNFFAGRVLLGPKGGAGPVSLGVSVRVAGAQLNTLATDKMKVSSDRKCQRMEDFTEWVARSAIDNLAARAAPAQSILAD